MGNQYPIFFSQHLKQMGHNEIHLYFLSEDAKEYKLKRKFLKFVIVANST